MYLQLVSERPQWTRPLGQRRRPGRQGRSASQVPRRVAVAPGIITAAEDTIAKQAASIVGATRHVTAPIDPIATTHQTLHHICSAGSPSRTWERRGRKGTHSVAMHPSTLAAAPGIDGMHRQFSLATQTMLRGPSWLHGRKALKRPLRASGRADVCSQRALPRKRSISSQRRERRGRSEIRWSTCGRMRSSSW